MPQPLQVRQPVSPRAGMAHPRRWGQLLPLALVLGGTCGLPACSDQSGRPENSELRVDSAPATHAPQATGSTSPDELEAKPLAGVGRRYQVAVGTAYFFDKPVQSAPNGRYLRRGDTFFGEGETNGFVKTGFVQPNGAAGTAWLKLAELRRMSGEPANAGPATSNTPETRATLPPRQASPATPAPGLADAVGVASTAVVRAARAYFYNAPDLLTPRKAYCEQGDKVRILESSGAAVYVTFTNWEKVTTTGWMRRDALQ